MLLKGPADQPPGFSQLAGADHLMGNREQEVVGSRQGWSKAKAGESGRQGRLPEGRKVLTGQPPVHPQMTWPNHPMWNRKLGVGGGRHGLHKAKADVGEGWGHLLIARGRKALPSQPPSP